MNKSNEFNLPEKNQHTKANILSLENLYNPKNNDKAQECWQGKRKAISTDKEIFSKQPKLEPNLRNKSTAKIENIFVFKEKILNNKKLIKITANSTMAKIKTKREKAKDLLFLNNNDNEPTHLNEAYNFFEKIIKKMHLNERNLYINNQKNFEQRKNLEAAFMNEKVKLYLLNSQKQMKGIKYVHAEETINLKKQQIEIIEKIKNILIQIEEKKLKIKQDIIGANEKMDLKKKQTKEKLGILKERLQEIKNLNNMETKEFKKYQEIINDNKYKLLKQDQLYEKSIQKINEKEKEKSLSNVLNNYSFLISELNVFKKIIIIRGYDNTIPNYVSQDLIYFDFKKEIVYIKAFLENNPNVVNTKTKLFKSNSSMNLLKLKVIENGSYSDDGCFKNDKNSSNNFLFKNNISNNQNCSFIQTIPLKFDLLITLFNVKYEEVDYICSQKAENVYINNQIAMVFDMLFLNIMKEESAKNLVLCYFSELIINEVSGEFRYVINKNILDLIEQFIKTANKNTTRTFSLGRNKKQKIMNYQFELSISFLTSEHNISVIESKKIDCINKLQEITNDLNQYWTFIFGLETEKNENINDSFGGILLKLKFLESESQINLVFCNIQNNDLTSSLLRRGKIQNSEKIKKEMINNKIITHNLGSKASAGLANDRKNVIATGVSFKYLFDDLEIKNFNLYINFIDFEAKFNCNTKIIPKLSEEAIESTMKEKFEQLYNNGNEKEIFENFYGASDKELKKFDNHVYYQNWNGCGFSNNSNNNSNFIDIPNFKNADNSDSYKNINNFSRSNSKFEYSNNKFSKKEKNLCSSDNNRYKSEDKYKILYKFDDVKYNIDPSIIKNVGKYFV